MCEFCGWDLEGNTCCPSRSPRQVDGISYYCSREAGHEGPHIACAMSSHDIERWEFRFSVVIITQDGKRRAVGCSTRTVEFVKEANSAADGFEVLPLETFWSMIADYPPNGWEASENA